MSDLEFYQRVLACFAFDYCDELWWRLEHGTTGEPDSLTFHVLVNDVFDWGTADVEPITSATLPELEQAFADVLAIKPGDASEAAMLYAARRRGQRPQGAMYKYIDAPVQHLFNAAGPEREISMLNPVRPTAPVNASPGQ